MPIWFLLWSRPSMGNIPAHFAKKSHKVGTTRKSRRLRLFQVNSNFVTNRWLPLFYHRVISGRCTWATPILRLSPTSRLCRLRGFSPPNLPYSRQQAYVRLRSPFNRVASHTNLARASQSLCQFIYENLKKTLHLFPFKSVSKTFDSIIQITR